MSKADKIHPLVVRRVVVRVAQLVRALDCGSRGRGFESRLSPFLNLWPIIRNAHLKTKEEASPYACLFFYLLIDKLFSAKTKQTNHHRRGIYAALRLIVSAALATETRARTKSTLSPILISIHIWGPPLPPFYYLLFHFFLRRNMNRPPRPSRATVIGSGITVTSSTSFWP